MAGNVNQQIKKESLTKPYKFCGISLKRHSFPVNLAGAPKDSKIQFKWFMLFVYKHIVLKCVYIFKYLSVT